ncbi:MAG: FliM/FliN family flagellar motor switch protein [bacterium]
MENKNAPTIHPVSFSVLKKEKTQEGQGEITSFGDVPIKVSVEIGRTKKYVKDVVNMKEGEIYALDKLTGEPFDILANGKIIAKGQIVVINDIVGIRVTELVNE